MKALVTGAAGFVGRHLVRRLKETGAEVIAVDIRPVGGAIRVDVTDGRSLSALMMKERPEAVFHLAAHISAPESVVDPIKYFHNNAIGTAVALEAARQADVSLFIYISSLAVYGEPTVLPITEASPVAPVNPYGASKLMGEEAVKVYNATYGLHYLIFRPSNIYGIGQNPEYAGVIAAFVKAVSEGRRPIIYGDGLQTRDFIDVKDVAELLAIAGTKRKVIDQTFNVSSGISVNIRELLGTVTSAAKKGQLIPIYKPKRPGDIRRSEVSNQRAREAFNWSPRYRLSEEIHELLKWQADER
ncbi:MAG: NAD-dependent epimerase/dehydratase family protein [Nitrososphaerota archaeon]|nr:NAD-dependent epimerase/dehydratase family protein [Nitrososphaerota archaeon]MDG7038123.1 NAD-dependent epimerase/dehydratase family protein [Nitrososphaerota archaeon]